MVKLRFSLKKRVPNNIIIYYIHPPKRTNMAQGRVLGGSRRRAVAKTCLADTKMPRVPLAFPPKNGCLKRQAINIAPLRWVRARGTPFRSLREWVSLAHKMRLLGFPGSRVKQSQPTKHNHHNIIWSKTNCIPQTVGQKRIFKTSL